jgi:hypothetical protein
VGSILTLTTAVAASKVLQHCAKQKRGLREILDLLAPGLPELTPVAEVLTIVPQQIVATLT